MNRIDGEPVMDAITCVEKKCYWWHEIGCVKVNDCTGPITKAEIDARIKARKEKK